MAACPLIDVLHEDGTISLAKIGRTDGYDYMVAYMVRTDRKHNGERVYDYDMKNIDIITHECINGYYDTNNEAEAGYQNIGNGFIRMSVDDDSEYEPERDLDMDEDEDEDEDVSEDESVVDESEEED
jgi:hypothetical protein